MRTVLLITLLAACSKTNPYYCPGHPDDNCLLDADVNAPQGCTTSSECTNPAKPICDNKVCVACTADDIGACSGTTPVCSATNTCTACTANDQCDSAVCLGDGSCADAAQVAYVAATGDDANACTRAALCKTIASAATKKPIVKVTSDLDEAVVLNGVNVTIVGNGATAVRRSSLGAIFELRGTSTITIRDLTIREAAGASVGNGLIVAFGEPVDLTLDRVNFLGNTALGLVVQGGTLKMSRSIVAANLGGGALFANKFDIANSLFVANGGQSSTYPGLTLTPSTGSSFKFNTVANNGAASSPKGMSCNQPISSSNTIVSGNDVSANCSFEYSLFDTNVTVSGTNRTGEPKFKNTTVTNPGAADFYRIESSSEAVDKADPASAMAIDIDGDSRPQGNAPDIGADEAK